MKKFAMIMLSVFVLAACGDSDSPPRSTFDRELRGMWFSNDTSVYNGSLFIDYDKITIRGYTENQTPLMGDDARRPFKNFTKNIPLTGYSEDSLIFITDVGVLQDGIPYIYHTEDYGRIKLLRFTFGGRNETLIQVSN
ncbi:MAG: hypothetical protein LBP96_00810 [Bacteroidales bacterium]|jgi:hypothetical protein|nr:hypothetical protein [Bacteroidales bacterium]